MTWDIELDGKNVEVIVKNSFLFINVNDAPESISKPNGNPATFPGTINGLLLGTLSR